VTADLPGSKDVLAAEIWHRLFGFFVGTGKQRTDILSELALTPNDARALGTLDLEEGRTMRSLAKEWGCDASNATWIVDRLERRRLAERRSLSSDRRVKLVVLTAEGEAMRLDLMNRMSKPPESLLDMDRSDLEALASAISKLPAELQQVQDPHGTDKRNFSG
jgi:DNA-binding MarR family transcriptional regulator